MYLVDTNVISEFRKILIGKADQNVSAWAKDKRTSTLFLSAMTCFELEYGALLLERRDVRQGRVLRSWLDHQIRVVFAGRILPVDAMIARLSASLHVPDPRPERDAMIAATGLIHRMTVVTRDIADFKSMGVPVINPWEPQ